MRIWGKRPKLKILKNKSEEEKHKETIKTTILIWGLLIFLSLFGALILTSVYANEVEIPLDSNNNEYFISLKRGHGVNHADGLVYSGIQVGVNNKILPYDWFFIGGELGGWERGSDSNFNSFVGIFQIGFNFKFYKNFYMKGTEGFSYISQTNRLLATNFEFNEQGSIGVKFPKFSIGFLFSHFSNAGIRQPNIGQDFMGFEANLFLW